MSRRYGSAGANLKSFVRYMKQVRAFVLCCVVRAGQLIVEDAHVTHVSYICSSKMTKELFGIQKLVVEYLVRSADHRYTCRKCYCHNDTIAPHSNNRHCKLSWRYHRTPLRRRRSLLPSSLAGLSIGQAAWRHSGSGDPCTGHTRTLYLYVQVVAAFSHVLD